MGYQDLTPKLRTRLSRVERLVGLFVTAATVLLIAGFCYYAYRTAERKGWFDTKIRYETGVDDSSGIKPGDPVFLMGFPVGEVTEVIPNEPWSSWKNITIRFFVRGGDYSYYGYVWSDSKARVAAQNILGSRAIEVQKGRFGLPTILEEDGKITGMLDRSALVGLLANKRAREIEKSRQEVLDDFGATEQGWDAFAKEMGLEIVPPTEEELYSSITDTEKAGLYNPWKKDAVFLLNPEESIAIGERVEQLSLAAEQALPNILSLTNLIGGVLTNTHMITSNVNALISDARPAVDNVNRITGMLSEPKGAFGEWMLPTNLNMRIDDALLTANLALSNAAVAIDTAGFALTNANNTITNVDGLVSSARTTITTTDTNLAVLASNLNLTLNHLSGITSNLNQQVGANTNLISEISSLVVTTDELLQGLQRHWLFRGAFKDKDKDDDQDSDPPGKRPARKRFRGKGAELLLGR